MGFFETKKNYNYLTGKSGQDVPTYKTKKDKKKKVYAEELIMPKANCNRRY